MEMDPEYIYKEVSRLDIGDPETRLLLLSDIGWLLVGALATILIRTKKKGQR